MKAIIEALIQLERDINKYAEDTYWCGPAETISERLAEIIEENGGDVSQLTIFRQNAQGMAHQTGVNDA